MRIVVSRREACAMVDRAPQRTVSAEALGCRQVFGSVTPCWPWYLPPRSL
jgi:hypothetical protein